MWTTLIIILFWLLAAHGAAQEQKYFYIYEWDDELADVYPPPGSKLDPKASYAHEFYANGGYGELVDGSSGMFATWQFSLFKNLMARLRVSDRRTMDPSKASAFIIPYDGGTHSFIDHKTGKIRLASPHGWQAIHRLKQASLTPNWKNGGHDHFSIFSVTGYQMVGIGTKVFYMQICQNCTVLSIETTPLKIAIAGRTHKYWYSIPYPSSYHWWEHMIDKPWAMNSTPRPTLTIFIGSVKTLNSASNSLRRKLFDECGMHPDDKCMWYTAAHSCTGVLNQSAAVQHYRRSTFCLAPPGDSLTRKSLFDSYLTGCIPVLFARASLTQYSWHLSPEEIEASTVYIPKLDVINGAVKFMDVLKAIRPEAISRKQRVIEQLAPRLQYSMVPKSHPAPPKGSASNPNPWIAPFPDAAEVTIDHILDSRTIEPVTGFSAAELREMQVRQRRRMETDPDYMGMAQKIPGEKRKGKHRNKKKRFGRQGEDQPAAVAAGVREDEI